MKPIENRHIGNRFGKPDLTAALSFSFRFRPVFFIGALSFAAISVLLSISGLTALPTLVGGAIFLVLLNLLAMNAASRSAEWPFAGDPHSTGYIRPALLGVITYVPSFGALAIVALMAVYLVSSAVESKVNAINDAVQKIPGTQFYNVRDTTKQTAEVRGVLTTAARPDGEVREIDDVSGRLHSSGDSEVRAAVSAAEVQNRDLVLQLLSLPAPIGVVCFVTLLWGIFYFPAACVVAANTRSVSSTINPRIGLATVKTLGLDYAKLVAIFVILLFASSLITLVTRGTVIPIGAADSANLPAVAVCGFIAFYLSIVYSVILGNGAFKFERAG